MINGNLIKGIGIAATVIGMGATIVTNWVGEKMLDEKINEKINEALSKREYKEES